MYFTNENTLGLGNALQRSGRLDVRYHGHPDLPEVPLGTLDVDWMPSGISASSSSPGIGGSRPAELHAYHEYGIRSV